MKYFFVLGNHPSLSVAELSAMFPSAKDGLISQNIFIFDIPEKINPEEIIRRLGGTIKLGLIKEELSGYNTETLIKSSTALIEPKNITGKFQFGVSYYGDKKVNTKVIGMEIKKFLKNAGISCRHVTSRDPVLSSVVVEQNKLIGRGIEIILIQSDNRILVGQTLAVQPFKELSFRDYGRPSRDDHSGMIPPKLAQIMINLSSPLLNRRGAGGKVLLDPFCGSGTIITEALLMGYDNIIGSDVSSKAIEDTEKNIQWIIQNFQLQIAQPELHNLDAISLSKKIKPNSIDVIVTEPYLGPQRGSIDIQKIIYELETLYSKSLAEFQKVLKPGGRVVMIWPLFYTKQHLHQLNPKLNNFTIINPLPSELQKYKQLRLTNRNTMIYNRAGQKVWREIVILEKKK
jgi:tRNA G10  N-methylase Trm11